MESSGLRSSLNDLLGRLPAHTRGLLSCLLVLARCEASKDAELLASPRRTHTPRTPRNLLPVRQQLCGGSALSARRRTRVVHLPSVPSSPTVVVRPSAALSVSVAGSSQSPRGNGSSSARNGNGWRTDPVMGHLGVPKRARRHRGPEQPYSQSRVRTAPTAISRAVACTRSTGRQAPYLPPYPGPRPKGSVTARA